MSSRAVAASVAAVALLAALAIRVRPLQFNGAFNRGPASFAEPAVPASQAGGARSFRFKRDVAATMGERALVELHLRGRLWARESLGGDFTGYVKVDSIASPQGKAEELPWFRIQLGSAGASSSEPRISCSEGSEEVRGAAVRFALDVLDQYRFFSKRDLQGSYRAKFRQMDASHFRKSKLSYLEAPYSTAKISESRHSLTLSGAGFPSRIEGSEQLTLGEDQVSVRSVTSYLIEEDGALGDALGETKALTWSDEVADSKRAPRHSGRGLASAGLPTGSTKEVRSLQELLAKLGNGTPMSGSERLSWFREAVKRVNAEQSGRIEPLRRALPEVRSQPEEFALLVGAMASASAPDAGRALVETYRDQAYPPQLRAMILSAWTAADVALSNETAAFLISLASDPGTSPDEDRSALLALGAQALKGGDPGVSAQIEQLLISKLQRAATPADAVAALDAMGNTGSVDFLPSIQAYLNNPSEHVRAHAYLALRFIPGSNVLALITSGSSDSSGEVQGSVTLSLSLRDSAS